MSNGIRVRFSATRTILVTPGSAVIVRVESGGSFAAVVASLGEGVAQLTFTPPGAPREVPLGTIISAVRGKRPVDPRRIPEFQARVSG